MRNTYLIGFVHYFIDIDIYNLSEKKFVFIEIFEIISVPMHKLIAD